MAASKTTPKAVQLGVLELDLKAGELRKHGIRVKLQEQPFQVLRVLIEHPGQVVTKEELQERIWPSDTFVDFDHGLHSAITRLREALGDSAESPRFIETLPRRGYRFIAPVQQIEERIETETEPAKSAQPEVARVRKLAVIILSGLLAGVALLAVVLGFDIGGAGRWLHRESNPKIHSLAVLPLQNLSADPAQDYFADGMTDTLIANLSRVNSFRVISRTSAMHYKGSHKTLPEIARELNVDAVIEGSVMRSGQRVRITAQLVDARTDQHLWAQSYERDLEDVLVLQSEISHDIAEEINSELRGNSAGTRVVSARAVNPDAYLAYLRGRYYWNKRSPESLQDAIGYLKQSVQIDPSFAQGFSGLADAYSSLCLIADVRPREIFPLAKEAALRAVQLDDGLAEAHASLGYVKLWFDWDWVGAEAEFKRALDLNPDYATAHQWYAEYLRLMGRLEESVAEGKKALELDPLSLIINMELGLPFYVAHRYREATGYFQKALEMDPNFGLAHCVLGWTYEEEGKYPQAISELRRALELDNSPPVLASLGHAYAASGQHAEARAMLQQLRRRAQRGYVGPNFFAIVYSGLHENEKALASLEQAYAERHWSLVWLRTARFFDPLRSDPRYADLSKRMNFPQ